MKFISYLFCFTVMIVSSSPAISQSTTVQHSTSTLSTSQSELLNFAYETAKSDGHKNPSYFIGILIQESKIGDQPHYRVSGVKDRVFGIAQLKLRAALEVMKRWPEMWKYLDTHTDEELQARLILDDKFNIRVASKYTLLMGINSNPEKAITSYNLGSKAAQEVDPYTFKYTQQVREHAVEVEKYTLSAE